MTDRDRGFVPIMKVDARIVLALIGERRGPQLDDLRRRATETITRESRRLLKLDAVDTAINSEVQNA